MTGDRSQMRTHRGAVARVDGVPHAIARAAAGVILRRLGPDPVTLFLSEAAMLDLGRSGRLRVSEPGRGRR